MAGDARPRLGLSGRRRFQSGGGFAMVMIVSVVIVFFATLAAKMGPAYMTYFQVRSAMDKVVARPDMRGENVRQVIPALLTQINLDSIYSVGKKDFKISRDGSQVLLVLDYDVQEHIGFNVDVLMHFDYQVPISTQP
jgi:hypothetical protein